MLYGHFSDRNGSKATITTYFSEFSNEKNQVCHRFLVNIFTKSLFTRGVDEEENVFYSWQVKKRHHFGRHLKLFILSELCHN